MPREVLGSRSVRLVDRERLKIDVHRLRVAGDGAERSVVVKWSDPVVARRCRLVAWQWLPAAGLEDLGPPLLGVAADPSGEGAWHIYEDLPAGRCRRTRRSKPRCRRRSKRSRASIPHSRNTASHECRLWGGDRGIRFYSANVRDAAVALRSWTCEMRAITARDELLRRWPDLKAEQSERAQALAAPGGPETLVHGDLWPTNVLSCRRGTRPARLIDWDEAAARADRV